MAAKSGKNSNFSPRDKILYIFTKSSNKVAITHFYIEQQVWNLNMLQFTEKYMNNLFERNCVATILWKI